MPEKAKVSFLRRSSGAENGESPPRGFEVDNEADRPHIPSMSTPITREELDAKLGQNVAEVKAIASEMRADMAAQRADNQTQFSALNDRMASMEAFMREQSARSDSQFNILNFKIDSVDTSLSAKIDGIDRSLSAKIDGVEKGVEGKIDGLKSSISTMQWLIATVLAVGALYVGYLQLKVAETSNQPVASSPATPPAQPAPSQQKK